jgi:hypothetical protein
MIMHDLKFSVTKVFNKEHKDKVIRLMCLVMFGYWDENLELRNFNTTKSLMMWSS